MGVSLPSDIVLDVMRNADPTRLAAAAGKLRSIDGDGATAGFAGVLNDAGGMSPRALGLDQPLAAEHLAFGRAEPQGSHVDFERMVLRNLLESLLPDASSGTFGTGPSAGVWRSLAADQLAGLYADAGGLGIAQTLSAGADGGSGATEQQWPYFSNGKIEAFAG